MQLIKFTASFQTKL